MTTTSSTPIEYLVEEVSHKLQGYKKRFSEGEEASETRRQLVQKIQQKPKVEKLTAEQSQRFEDELSPLFAEFAEGLEEPPREVSSKDDLKRDGVLWLDAFLMSVAQQGGDIGAFFAEVVEETSRKKLEEHTLEEVLRLLAEERWPSFAISGGRAGDGTWPLCLENLAYAHYLDELKDAFAAENRKRVTYTSGIQHDVSQQVVRLCFAPDNNVEPVRDTPHFVVTDASHTPIARLSSDLPQKLYENIPSGGEMSADVLKFIQKHFQRGLKLFNGVTTHRLLRAVARECAAQFLDGKSFTEARELRFEGGMRGLAEAIGEPHPESGKVQHNLRQILRMGRWIEVRWADGSYIGGLWNERLLRDRKTNQVCCEIDAAPFFVPTFAHRYKTPSKQVVPIIPLPPGLSEANSRHQGPLAACQFELVLLMTNRKAYLAREGGAPISREERHRIANQFKLKPEVFEDYFELWQHDTDSGPAMIEAVEPDLFILADNELFGDARAFMLEGGRRAEAGRRSQKKKKGPKSDS